MLEFNFLGVEDVVKLDVLIKCLFEIGLIVFCDVVVVKFILGEGCFVD